MFCLRHYGQDAGGKRTTINYFSTRASAGAVAGTSPMGVSTASTGSGQASLDTNGKVGLDASGNGAASGAVAAAGATGAVAEASTTTVRTVIHGSAAASGTAGAGGEIGRAHV